MVAANPPPDKVTDEPMPPVEGVSVTCTTVKIPVGELVPSVARMVLGPAAELGIVKVVPNEPDEDVDTVEGEVVCAVPSYSIVIVAEPMKPVPVTVTTEPTLPLVELRAIEEETTNNEVAMLELASVAWIVFAPAADASTVKEPVKVPVGVVSALALVC